MKSLIFKVAQKYGFTDKTVDEEFEKLRKEINQLRENIYILEKNFKNLDSIKDFSFSTTSITQAMEDVFSKDELVLTLQISQELDSSINKSIHSFLSKHENVKLMLGYYSAKLKAFSKRIKKRDQFLLEYDKEKMQLSSLLEKLESLGTLSLTSASFSLVSGTYLPIPEKSRETQNSLPSNASLPVALPSSSPSPSTSTLIQSNSTPQIMLAEQRVEIAREKYEEANAQLMKEMRELLHNLDEDITPIFNSLLLNQKKLFEELQDAQSNLLLEKIKET